MADRNWASITSGATFEALMSALVFFEDPKAAVLGRDGKDGGQDARSGDRTLVYQAKFHQTPSAAKAIRDAKSEAAKIAKYKAAGHARQPQWAGVTEWKLVTNAPFNTTDDHNWLTDVVPLFQAMGLSASYWERANLDALLDKHPSVHRAFFEGEPRSVLTLPEAAEALERDVPFLPRATRLGFHGREEELGEILRLVDQGDKVFVVLHGPGGVGKTRLMLEAGSALADKGWQVLWANKETMSTGRWYRGIIAERPTVLLIDEPEDARLLKQLVEQVGIGRARSWRVVLNVRSPKDPVIKFLGKPGQRRSTELVEVKPLEQDAAKTLALELIDSSKRLSVLDAARREQAATKLARAFDRFPVWIGMAVDLLERHGDLGRLPDTAEALADAYLSEIYDLQREQSPETVEILVRWLALLETVNSEDDKELEVLRLVSGLPGQAELQRGLAALVKRNVVVRRGARDRLLEVKPDVLRDHVLRRWLLVWTDFGAPGWVATADASGLITTLAAAVVDGSFSQRHRRLLRSLGRCEAILRAGERPEVRLLSRFLELLAAKVPEMTASRRVLLAEVAVPIASLLPKEVLALCDALRTLTCPDDVVETLLGSRTVTHDDVVLELAWLVLHAGMGVREPAARREVIGSMATLVAAETRIQARRERWSNDGKRAAQMAERLVQGGNEFWSDFTTEAADYVVTALQEAQLPDAPSLAALSAFAKPLLAVERSLTEASGHGITIQNSIILPGGAEWALRDRVRTALREAVERHGTGVPAQLWELLAFAHSTALRAREKVPNQDQRDQVVLDSLDDLTWAEGVLVGRVQNLGELSAARKLWSWHHQFDDREPFKQSAQRLEDIYLSNRLSAEFEPLTQFDVEDSAGAAARGMAELLSTGPSAGIEEFLTRAVAFFGEEGTQPVLRVAPYLGDLAPDHEPIQDYVRAALPAATREPHYTFATIIVRTWVAALRLRGKHQEVRLTFNELVALPPTARDQAVLIAQVYGSYLPEKYGVVGLEEHRMVRAMAHLFVQAEREFLFTGTLGWSFMHDWPGFRQSVDDLLAATPPERQTGTVSRLYDSVYWGARWMKKQEMPYPAGFSTWLLDKLVPVPDLDGMNDMDHWHLTEILKGAGRPTVKWLSEAIRRRGELAETEEGDSFGFPFRRRLSMYVEPISSASADDGKTIAAIDELLAKTTDPGRLGHQLPRYAHDVDPEGLVVPARAAASLQALSEDAFESAWRWARFAGVYSLTSQGWRTIAREVCRFATALPEKKRNSLYQALQDPTSRGWSSGIGEVPQLFVDGVQEARTALESETDPALLSFRKWKLGVAEAELEWQEGRAKEERGE